MPTKTATACEVGLAARMFDLSRSKPLWLGELARRMAAETWKVPRDAGRSGLAARLEWLRDAVLADREGQLKRDDDHRERIAHGEHGPWVLLGDEERLYLRQEIARYRVEIALLGAALDAADDTFTFEVPKDAQIVAPELFNPKLNAKGTTIPQQVTDALSNLRSRY